MTMAMATITVTKPKQKLILFVVVVLISVNRSLFYEESVRDLRVIFRLRMLDWPLYFTVHTAYINTNKRTHTIYVHVDGKKVAVKTEH